MVTIETEDIITTQTTNITTEKITKEIETGVITEVTILTEVVVATEITGAETTTEITILAIETIIIDSKAAEGQTTDGVI